jgi:hypothetical protein
MSVELLDRPDAASRLADRVLELDRGTFADQFDRSDFAIRHYMAGHELFALPRSVELARITAQERPPDVYYDAGAVQIGQRWEDAPKLDFPVDEIVRRIETSGAWIILRRVDLHPAYDELPDRCIEKIVALGGGQLQRRMKRREIILFITSPNRTTTDHIDCDCSFLLQVCGSKQLSVFDRNDRDVLPEEEIERFWSVDTNAALYKPHLQDCATVYNLKPGDGVHIPINAPHWLQNGNNVSISVNINFWAPDSERANLYRANHYLRPLPSSGWVEADGTVPVGAARFSEAIHWSRRFWREPFVSAGEAVVRPEQAGMNALLSRSSGQ